ncbi:MAG: amidophosphoribosyltransferase [Candidatus Altiarchaeota archaeon]
MSGLFGVVSSDDCVETLFLGTDYHSHLGTQCGGLAVLGKDGFQRKVKNISRSQFKSKFFEDVEKMRGKSGIGVISSDFEQPLMFESKFGLYAIVVDGLIQNKKELVKDLISTGTSFIELSNGSVNTTELVAKLIARGDSLVAGIENMFAKIKGSISVLILNHKGIYAARDRHGHSPLVIGEGDRGIAVTSESCAFPNLGFKVKKFLNPGEVVLLTPNGVESIREGGSINKICTFLWIYTGFPASSYEGINAEIVREKCGRALAKRDKVKADLVSGVPDSGLAHAIGYAMESGLPYRRPLVKYTPGYGRSYTPPDQKTRDQIALMKLIPIKEVIDGKSIIICEDSIVRGTQLKNYTVTKLFDSGARQVHARPACPPLMFPCRYNVSTRTYKELVARRAIEAIEGKEVEDVSEYLDPDSEKYKKMIDWIAKELGVTSLMYQRLDDMIEAVGAPKEKLCTYCWNGQC